jgi:predicted transcriptional regulator
MTLEVSEQAAAYLRQLTMAPEDYVAAIRSGRAEIRAGLGVPDEQADEWLKSQHA